MSLVHVRKGRSESGNISDSIQDEHFDSSNEGAGEESDYSNRSDTEGSEGAEDQEERRVDDDEDRSNPQYIPKRGTFYEHDDRTASSRDDETQDGGETPGADGSDASGGGEAGGRGERETPAEPRRQRAPRKSDTCDKWSHDKYNENDQTPKSRDELVSIYGYDIRNEDGPPHARRNRRYGRGPNKYTRTWEDEEAYRRASAAAPAPRKPPPTGEEDFPALDKTPARKINHSPRKPKAGRPPPRQGIENGGGDRRHGAPATRPPAASPKLPVENITISATVNNSTNQNRKVTASNTPRSPQLNQVPSPRENAQPTHNNTQPTRRTIQPQLTIPQQQQQQPPQQQLQQVPSTTGPAQLHQQKPPTPQQLAPPHLPGKQPIQHQPPQPVPVAQQQHSGGGEGGRGKRYSSLRQRPLVEGYAPQAAPPVQAPPAPGVSQPPAPTQPGHAQSHRYVPEYQGGPAKPPAHQASPGPQMQLPQQQMMHQQVHPVPQTQQAPPPQHPQQVLARGIPMLTPQEAQLVAPQHAVHTHALTGQLAMMPAQYIQGGTSAVYAAPPPPAVYAQPAPPYPHQIYPHHNYTPHQRTAPTATGTSPGITYYGPADHQLAAEARPQRRPTAAIPIVPPPPAPAKSSSGQQDKESIDRIVDNMFVRKQRPQGTAFSGADTAKSQIEQKSRATSEGSKRSLDSSKESSRDKSSSPPVSLSSSLISADSRQSADKSAEQVTEQPIESREFEKSIEKLSIKEVELAELVTSISDKEPVTDLGKSADVADVAQAISNPSNQPTEGSVPGESKEIV